SGSHLAAADAMGRANCVAALQMGVTLEQLIAGLVASGEYALRYGSDTAFAQSLYYKLLNRVPGSSELASMRAAVPMLGRAGVAQLFLSSPEYRGLQVRRLFSELLHRAAGAGEVNAFVGSGADVLTLTAADPSRRLAAVSNVGHQRLWRSHAIGVGK